MKHTLLLFCRLAPGNAAGILFFCALLCSIGTRAQTCYSWRDVGSAGFSAGTVSNTSIAINSSGTPYVVYQDAANGNAATVMKYTGSSWVTVGSAGFSVDQAYSPSIAIDGSGTPYVAFADYITTDAYPKATVMKFNGSSWVTVGSAAFSAGEVDYISIAIGPDGTPYVAYRDDANSLAATVAKFNGSSWVLVGSAGFSVNRAESVTIAIDGSGTPYVVYEDFGNSYAATVMKYNGSSWVTVGSAGFSVGQAISTSIAIDGSGTPYVVYEDVANGYAATVMKYIGSSWATVGSADFSEGTANYPSIAIDGSGTPYVAYQDYGPADGYSWQATVMKYNGSSWVAAGYAGLSAGQASYTTMAIDGSGAPYVAYEDYSAADGYSYKTTVQKLVPGAAAISGVATICPGNYIVLSDPAGGGTWSNDNTSIATLSAYGLSNYTYVTGVAAGTTTVSYTYGSCTATVIFTVNPLPAGILLSETTICSAGGNTFATEATTGGVWSDANGDVSVNSSGIVTGQHPGSDNVIYTLPTGCSTQTPINLDTAAQAINGTLYICAGNATELYDYTPGGDWFSSDNTKATTPEYGDYTYVNGVAAGAVTITYLVSNTCGTSSAMTSFTVDAVPAAITVASTVCTGSTILAHDASSGGTWSDAYGYVSIGSTSGHVTGLTTGGDYIYYYLPDGCGTYTTINVLDTATAQPITGTAYTCVGGTTSYLYDATPGGTWAISNDSVGSLGYYYYGGYYVYGNVADTVTISYTINNGCNTSVASVVVTINPLPKPINVPATVCAGSTTFATDSTTGGVWSDYYGNISIDSTTGLVTGLITGGDNIYYTLPTGCSMYTAITVLDTASAQPITGTAYACVGGTTSYLYDATPGGTWAISNDSVGSLGYYYYYGGYYVYGNVADTVTVSYTISNGCGSSAATVVVTINPNPAPITVSNVCSGSTETAVDATTGGVWGDYYGNVSIGSGTGVVTGLHTGGGDNISYTLPNGCYVSASITVDTTASSISGTPSACIGGYSYLTTAVPYGGNWNWTSSNDSIAVVSEYYTYSAYVSGVAPGVVTIRDSVNNSCGISIATMTFTVNPSPGAISVSNVCVGTTTLATDPTPGGTWDEYDGYATVYSTTGVVTGLVAGNGTIYYYSPAGCVATAVVSVDAAIGPINGTKSVCAGNTTHLTDITTGGSWSSSNTAIGSVGATGIVTGISSGSVIITYFAPGGCDVIALVTVNQIPAPGPISGTAFICAGATTSLSDGVSGGAWSSGGTGIATVNSAGVVTGVSTGSANISYTMSNSCGTGRAIQAVTVNPSSSAGTITGTAAVCTGDSTSLADAASGGVWNSSAPGTGSIDAAGEVTGITTGTTVISYTVMTGSCTERSTKTVTVNPIPIGGIITGTGELCVGATTNLTDAAAGGVWASSAGAVAAVNSIGLVTGVGAGVANISYTVTNSCGTARATMAVTVNGATGGTITGPSSVATGTNITLTDALGGGVWSASNSNAIVSGGIVTGESTGTVTISYSVAGSCGTGVATEIVTVTTYVAGITGTASVCIGSTTALTDATGGGAWSSNLPSVATVGASTGVVTGVVPGTATVSYTLSGTTTTVVVTVSSNPAVITGASTVCMGATKLLTDVTTGGAWSSTGTAGSVDASGNVTGMSAGTITVSYQTGSCAVSRITTINPSPSPILGIATVCNIGGTTNLSDATTGATGWASSNTAFATVNGGGVVTGVAVGSAAITYTIATGCSVTTMVTIGASAGAINGNAPVCAGSSMTLTDGTGAGAWNSSNATIATVGSGTGNVTGIAGGTATVTYVGGSNGCKTTAVVTVNAIAAISGSLSTCIGSAISLSDGTSGGTWSSDNSGVASVGSATGVVTGGGGGTANITYLIAATGCSRAVSVTINATASAISGPDVVCAGSTITLTDATAGGTWSGSNAVIATVGTSSGIVTPVNAGTVNISYHLGGCNAVQVVTVAYGPATITGPSSVCLGFVVLLGDVTASGSWSSTNPGIGSVDGSGNVTGLATGSTTISYSIAAGCASIHTFTVNPLPTAINGTKEVCAAGATTNLADATTGATGWTSSNTSAATVNGGGVVTGVAMGTTIITYKIASGCAITTMVTVNALPSAGTISGPTTVSHSGSTITLVDATTGGIWTSQHTGIATVGSTTGIVTAVTISGSDNISYTITDVNACKGVAIYSITATPAPPHSGGTTVGGGTTISVGDVVSIAADANSGEWSSSNTGIATVDGSGVVTGIAPGAVNITQVIKNGTDVTTIVSPVVVNALPIDVRVIPNPNNGSFTVKGTLGTLNDEEVMLEITDVLGQAIYKSKAMAQKGMINEVVTLNNALANGMYILNVKSGTENKVFHFVVEK